jgi:hypothetical protein
MDEAKTLHRYQQTRVNAFVQLPSDACFVVPVNNRTAADFAENKEARIITGAISGAIFIAGSLHYHGRGALGVESRRINHLNSPEYDHAGVRRDNGEEEQ